MKQVLWLIGCLTTGMVAAQNRTGIGTTNPQQRLSVDSTLNIDQGNFNYGTLSSLRFGSQSGEGMGSKRTAGSYQFGLDFYTNHIKRVHITQSGMVGIGTNDQQELLSVAGGMVFRPTGPQYGRCANAAFWLCKWRKNG